MELSLNKANNSLENMARKIDSLNNDLKERDYKINESMKQKQNISEKLSNQEMEFIDMNNTIHYLNNILKNHRKYYFLKKNKKKKIYKNKLMIYL